MFKNSFKINRGFRPLSSKRLNYTATWPLSTDNVRCQQIGRNQSITVNKLYQFALLPQLN